MVPGLLRTLSNDYTVKSWTKRIGNLEVRRYDEEFDGWTLQVEKRLTPDKTRLGHHPQDR